MGQGPFKKYVNGLGGGTSSKVVTKSDKWEGVKPKSDVTLSNFFLHGHYKTIDSL